MSRTELLSLIIGAGLVRVWDCRWSVQSDSCGGRERTARIATQAPGIGSYNDCSRCLIPCADDDSLDSGGVPTFVADLCTRSASQPTSSPGVTLKRANSYAVLETWWRIVFEYWKRRGSNLPQEAVLDYLDRRSAVLWIANRDGIPAFSLMSAVVDGKLLLCVVGARQLASARELQQMLLSLLAYNPSSADGQIELIAPMRCVVAQSETEMKPALLEAPHPLDSESAR